MAKIKDISVPAHDALIGYDKKLFVRAFLIDNSLFDDTTNNVTESFNGWIRKERAFSLISMFEAISDRLMARRAEFYNAIQSLCGDIAPNAFQRLQRRMLDAEQSKIIDDGHHELRVQDTKYQEIHIVNMLEQTCTCGYWQLNGIPCQHLLCCALKKG